jgi:DsbC/DsbD-like thiol-disulfide interchange protein
MRKIPLITLIALLPSAGFAQIEGLLGAEILHGGVDAQGRPLAALSLTLAPGWKTYWRAPGDGGLPPVFDWAGSGNIGGVEFFWPSPEVFDSAGFTNIGYFDALVLPFAITPSMAGEPISLRAHITLGICKDICIPADITLQADMAGGPSAPHPAIDAALADQPITAEKAGVGEVNCTAAAISDGVQLRARITLPPATNEVVVIEHRAPDIWVSTAQTQRSGEVVTAIVDFVPPSAAPFDLASNDLRITVLSDAGAVDIQGCPLD